MTYKTTSNFLKMFGYGSIENLPELPKYKMDENRQIVIEDILEEKTKENEKEETNTNEIFISEAEKK